LKHRETYCWRRTKW